MKRASRNVHFEVQSIYIGIDIAQKALGPAHNPAAIQSNVVAMHQTRG